MLGSRDWLERSPLGKVRRFAPWRHWATATVLEVGITVAVGAAALAVFRWRSHWSSIDTRLPYTYFGDVLVYGNTVFNAQVGNVFSGSTLGGPAGQQIGMSAYGVEWIPSWFAAHFGSAVDGPWLAMFRYWEFSYVASASTAYLALRWVRARRLPAILAAIAFCFVPQHQYNFASLYFTNLAVLPLAAALIVKMVGGSTFAQLVPGAWPLTGRWRHAAGVFLAGLCLFIGLTGANYYMIFAVIMIGSACAVMLVRRRWWPRALRLALLTVGSLIPLALSYLPIVLARHQAGLGTESALADRRAFAAYANGGDPFAMLLPFDKGSALRALQHVPVIRKFITEYKTSPLTAGSEYVFYHGGIVVASALLVLALGFLGGYNKDDFLRRASVLPSPLRGFALMFALSLAWYSRGGLGTFAAFVAPQVRGYARLAPLVTFCAAAMLAVVWSSQQHIGLPVRALAAVLLIIAAVEGVSSHVPLDPQPRERSFVLAADNGITTAFGGGVEVHTLGPAGARQLVRSATAALAPGCTVLVLPLARYPVDFELGLGSFYGYEMIKPGLLPSPLHWTSGGFQGTPNNAYTDRWLVPYRDGDYAEMLTAADAAGYCGALFFNGMHDAFHIAGPTRGSRYFRDAAHVSAALTAHYGAPCYTDADSRVQLYCAPR